MKRLITFYLLLTSILPLTGQNQPIPSNEEVESILRSVVKRLTVYINYCGSAETDPQTKESYVNLIMLEFEDGATMEVSNVFRSTENKYPVKKYFRNLIYLKDEENYSKVFFGFNNIKITRIVPDENDPTKYRAVGEFTQTFKAFRGDRESYADITVKFSDLYVEINHGAIKVKIGNTWIKSTKCLNPVRK